MSDKASFTQSRFSNFVHCEMVHIGRESDTRGQEKSDEFITIFGGNIEMAKEMGSACRDEL
jgi:hypothetical protein